MVPPRPRATRQFVDANMLPFACSLAPLVNTTRLCQHFPICYHVGTDYLIQDRGCRANLVCFQTVWQTTISVQKMLLPSAGLN
jgi:hypothetical protein